MTGQSINGAGPERLGVAGSGAIACGLAAVAARSGSAVLWARSDASAEKATKRIAKLIERAGWTEAGEVEVTTDLARLCAGSTVVVEAIVEERDAKAALMGELRCSLTGEHVLATTTSSLSIEDLAAASGLPERFCGLHVFNPVTKMDLIELVFPAAAADSTRQRAYALCEQLGKT
ncbi:MAG: 3-hydroxybutyryl-CoA dehydrogenase, partial [Solirubrobacteraceae bacterium]|nr:3-hydroxybutyryl-CoA dehydrogenase [Solirubrobacteraceae bacterium]